MNQPHENNSVPADGSAARPLSLSDRVRSLRLSDRPKAPASRGAWLPWLLCLVLGGTSAALAWRLSSTPEPEKDTSRDGPPVAGQPVVAPRENIALEAKGYIIPIQKIQVSPKISGMVVKLNFKEGDRVPAGFVLAVLEDVEYRAEKDVALARKSAAEHRLTEMTKYRGEEAQQTKHELGEAIEQRARLEKEMIRTKELISTKAASSRDYEQAWADFKSMDLRVERLRLAYKFMADAGPRDERIAATQAEIEQAVAELTRAAWRFGNREVRAPIGGIILAKYAEEGAMVNPAAFSNGLAASLCDLADLTKLEVDLAISERDISKVFKGQLCKLRAEAFPDRVYEGKVSRLMPTADRSKAAVPVRVEIDVPRDEEGHYLRPEMGAIVTFLVKK